MNEMTELLKKHFALFPKMEIPDAIKLLYQNEFGGEHIIKSEDESLARLKSELAGVSRDLSMRLFDDIGNGYIRLNLAALKDKISAETLNRIFVKSSAAAKGSIKTYYVKLNALHTLCKEGVLGFRLEELEIFLSEYEKRGYPPVSHSAAYKNTYAPVYRVVLKEYAKFIKLFFAIEAEFQKKSRVNLAIDGMSASGKSTLANLVAGVYEANIIHTDDFFLPPALRTRERLASPGGNIHYERFLSEVIERLENGKEFSYRVFDCSKSDFGGLVRVLDKPLNIIEGAYSMRPEFSHIYDIKVFMSIGTQSQKNRIKARNGDNAYKRFEKEWIPLENRYIEAFDIPSACDLVY